ncbi:MAG: ribbon-helix-helix domain-containing protein [Haloferacaceae archaeon]
MADSDRTTRITVRVPTSLLDDVGRLVEADVYESRSAAVRTALRQLDGVDDDARPTGRHPEHVVLPGNRAVADGGTEEREPEPEPGPEPTGSN